jgi:tRNA threonylcarbamoyl adenosine modification protein YjeE
LKKSRPPFNQSNAPFSTTIDAAQADNPLHQYSPGQYFEHLPALQPYPYQLALKTHSPDGIPVLAQSLAQFALQHPTLQLNVLLYGDLGVGKTTFSRSFIRTLTNSPALNVVSPTFTLQNYYRMHDRMINHCDLYRLKHANEVAILNLVESYQDDCPYPPHHLSESQFQPSSLEPTRQSQLNDFLAKHNEFLNSLPSTTTAHHKLPNRPFSSAQVNLLEWPHVLHNSPYMPNSFIRVDIHDKVYYKLIDIAVSGQNWTVPVALPDINSTNSQDYVVSTLGLDLTQRILKSFNQYPHLLDNKYTTDQISTTTTRQRLTDKINQDLTAGVELTKMVYDDESPISSNGEDQHDAADGDDNEIAFKMQHFPPQR